MIRILLICLVLIFGSYIANLWIRSYRVLPSKKEDIGILEGIDIEVFGKKGKEWHIEGSKAKLENNQVLIEEAKFQSEDTLLLADRALIDRITGEGLLEGNIRLYAKEGTVSTERAKIKLKEGRAYGDKHIIFRDKNNIVEGTEWSLQVKPLKVIIKNAKVRFE